MFFREDLSFERVREKHLFKMEPLSLKILKDDHFLIIRKYCMDLGLQFMHYKNSVLINKSLRNDSLATTMTFFIKTRFISHTTKKIMI